MPRKTGRVRDMEATLRRLSSEFRAAYHAIGVETSEERVREQMQELVESVFPDYAVAELSQILAPQQAQESGQDDGDEE